MNVLAQKLHANLEFLVLNLPPRPDVWPGAIFTRNMRIPIKRGNPEDPGLGRGTPIPIAAIDGYDLSGGASAGVASWFGLRTKAANVVEAVISFPDARVVDMEQDSLIQHIEQAADAIAASKRGQVPVMVIKAYEGTPFVTLTRKSSGSVEAWAKLKAATVEAKADAAVQTKDSVTYRAGEPIVFAFETAQIEFDPSELAKGKVKFRLSALPSTLFAMREQENKSKTPIIVAKKETRLRIAYVVAPGPNKPAAGTEGRIEKPTFGFERAKALQRTLCVADNGDVSTPATRAALIDLKAALYFPRKSAAIKSGIIEDEDQDAEIEKVVAAVPSCMDMKLAGPFEVGLVARFGEMTIRSRLRRALEKAGVAAPPELANLGNLSFGESIRPAVTTLRTEYNAKFHIPAGTSIDR